MGKGTASLLYGKFECISIPFNQRICSTYRIIQLSNVNGSVFWCSKNCTRNVYCVQRCSPHLVPCTSQIVHQYSHPRTVVMPVDMKWWPNWVFNSHLLRDMKAFIARAVWSTSWIIDHSDYKWIMHFTKLLLRYIKIYSYIPASGIYS